MTTLVLRSVKGSELTHNELDSNFVNLENEKIGASAFGNNTIMYKDSAGDMQALVVDFSTMVGRKATGEIVALSAAEVKAILNLTTNTLITGAVDPTVEGVNGDYYINNVSKKIFGPKASGAWPAGVSMIGPQGGTNLIPLFQFMLPVYNVGTGLQSLVNYNLPANTLTTNGQRSRFKYTLNLKYVVGYQPRVLLYFGANGFFDSGFITMPTHDIVVVLEGEFIKYGPSGLKMSACLHGAGVDNKYWLNNIINFAIPLAIDLQVQLTGGSDADISAEMGFIEFIEEA